MAAAAAVAAGRADAGLGIMAAARAFGLEFGPVTMEPYGLVVTAEAMDSPLLAPLWALLRSDRFQAAVTELGGYTTRASAGSTTSSGSARDTGLVTLGS